MKHTIDFSDSDSSISVNLSLRFSVIDLGFSNTSFLLFSVVCNLAPRTTTMTIIQVKIAPENSRELGGTEIVIGLILMVGTFSDHTRLLLMVSIGIPLGDIITP